MSQAPGNIALPIQGNPAATPAAAASECGPGCSKHGTPACKHFTGQLPSSAVGNVPSLAAGLVETLPMSPNLSAEREEIVGVNHETD